MARIDDRHPLIIIVGNCCSGKTTLASRLQQMGYNAHSCLQEHSRAPRLWNRHKPDILIVLYCTVETAQRRRTISWGKTRWLAQQDILQDARANAHLFIETDEMSREEVLAEALHCIENWRMKDE